ncbi:MAG: AgmX/PglI C-terminal domain-containing protein [Bdellovibrionales bacterium]
MIRITNEDGQPIRAFREEAEQRILLDDRLGFVSAASGERRTRLRKAAGAWTSETVPKCEFKLHFVNGAVDVEGLKGAKVTKQAGRVQLVTDRGIYFVESIQEAPAGVLSPEPKDKREASPLLILLALLFLVGGVIALWPAAPPEEKKAEEVISQPVVLKPMAPVVRAKSKDRIPPDPKLKAKKVVAKQLGFLGLLGKKDFRKAVGGLPTPAAQRTAGAGPGGTEGSGGELVAGMGKGLHQTTIGNTGVAGLGGIGTKGAGGGLGGYGDTAFGGVGSGTLSAVPLANQATVDQGLDRSQIQATIMRYLSQVRACYEEGLKRDQSLIGQVTMNFEINGTGNLNFARVGRSSLNDRPVESCISMKMMNWKFPEPRGGVNVKVSYPFMLRPVKS